MGSGGEKNTKTLPEEAGKKEKVALNKSAI